MDSTPQYMKNPSYSTIHNTRINGICQVTGEGGRGASAIPSLVFLNTRRGSVSRGGSGAAQVFALTLDLVADGMKIIKNNAYALVKWLICTCPKMGYSSKRGYVK